MTTMKTLKDLYVEQLRDLYSAETQLVRALPKMAAAASDPTLRQGFERHLDQTKVQAQRLESLFQDLGQEAGGHTCLAMQGLIAEGEEMMETDAAPAVKDAGLIAAAQRVEHYEIAGYGTVVRYAEVLGMTEHAQQLRTSEQEEKDTDLALTSASTSINRQAAQP